MELSLLKCKIHRVTVTETHVDYEGSCAIDETLMDAAGLREFEQIHLWNVTNGERLTTYAIRGKRDSGMISVNGSAAHKANDGDIMIIAAFAQMSEREAEHFKPHLIYVDGENRIRDMGRKLLDLDVDESGSQAESGALHTIEPQRSVPFVPVDQAVTRDNVFCLICGKASKAIKGHLTKTHGIDISTYRANYGLPKNFPMVAPSYSETRRQLAVAAKSGERLQAERTRKKAVR